MKARRFRTGFSFAWLGRLATPEHEAFPARLRRRRLPDGDFVHEGDLELTLDVGHHHWLASLLVLFEDSERDAGIDL